MGAGRGQVRSRGPQFRSESGVVRIIRDLGDDVLSAALKTVAVDVHLQDVDVVGEPVQQRSGQPLRPEDRGPLVEGKVGGYQDGAPLVALAEDLEEQFRSCGDRGTKPSSSMISRPRRDRFRCRLSRRLSPRASIISWTRAAAVKASRSRSAGSTNWVRRQVGEDDPGFFLLDVPDRQQGAAAFCVGGAEGGAAANPGRIGTGNEVLCGQPAAVLGAEADVLPIPHVGVPAPRSGRGQALRAYLSPQLGTEYAPVAEHDDAHFLGNRRGQFPEQFHRGVYSGPAQSGPVDAPGHGNGATPVDHADDYGGGLVAFERGINGQGQPGRNPTWKGPTGAMGRSRDLRLVRSGRAGPGRCRRTTTP